MKMRTLLRCLLLAFASVASQIAMAGTIFQDNFNSPVLNPAWQTLGGQGAYSVGGNDLRYYAQGPQSSPAGWSTTSLALALPFQGTNWVLDTEVTYSLDWCLGGSYTGPSVPNQGCSSGAQRPQVMVAFDPVTSLDRSALGGLNYADFDRGTDAWYGADSLSAWHGTTTAQGLLNPADSGIVNNIAGGTYWFRITRNGGTLTMNYSSDGVHYTAALSALLANPSGSFNELVLSGTTFLTAGSFADYHFVSITDAPEPGVALLSSLGLALLGALRFGRRRTAGK
jgi:hypothetical protein